MELHLPGSVCVKIVKDDELITVTRTSPDGTRIFLIENQRLYELNNGLRRELRTDEYDYCETELDGLIETIGCLIETTGGVSTGLLFYAIFSDLMSDKPLSWIPQGYYYFHNDLIFMVFETRELLETYLRYNRYDENPELNIDQDPDYDEMEGLPEVERKEYWISCDSDQYDVRKEFEHEHEF